MATPAAAAGVIDLTTLGTPYTQDFNTLAATGTSSVVPLGWDLSESGTNANTTYTAGTGSSNAGDTYSFGALNATERAFGGLRSGTLVPLVGAQFRNSAGTNTITSLAISYTGEQWRLGQVDTGRAADRLDFQLSTNATSVADVNAAWTNQDALDFSSPVVAGTVGALNGNTSSTALSATITGLSIPPGTSFWIRWADSDLIPGADDGLAVDDFSLTPFGGPTVPALSINDTSVAEGDAGTTTATFTVSLSIPAGPGGITYDIATADGSATSPSDYAAGSLTGQVIPEGSSSATFDVTVNGDTTVEGDESFVVNVTNVTGANVADGQGAGTITNDDVVAIRDIQGATHRSSLLGSAVTTTGIVTARIGNGFYLQDPVADSDDATSEAIFVFTSSAPTVVVGDAVRVSGTVSEFRAGAPTTVVNLTTTEITGPTITVQSSGNALPAATVIGAGGRVPPTQVIEDDATGDVESSGVFDPASDGIDFYESLEAMRVQVNNPIAVGPTSGFGEIPVVADGGANASVRTPRGGVLIRPNDFNPERVILDDTVVGSTSMPRVNLGDGFTAPAVGVLDYSFGNFKLNVTQALTRVDNGLAKEVTTGPGTGVLAVATFNVENLRPSDPPSKFEALADQIVDNLRSPDVIALEEIQDNSGAVNNGVVDANVTLDQLVAAIAAAGGPAYEWRQINPVNNADGGEPGGNIRVGFLYRTDRGLAFVDRPGGTSTAPTAVVAGASGPQLSFSPGRIDPTNDAWTNSRKPLVGEFTYRGETVFVVVNHFNSKGGDDPLFGRFQPPTRITEVQRHQQAEVVNAFVDSVLAVDGAANIVVLGDINDFDFSETVNRLKSGGVLHNLMDTLPANERYSYVFEGNSQVLDQILVSSGLNIADPAFDPVHINAEFADQQSDHDPSVTLIDFDDVWTFTGFLQPVDNGGVLNQVRAGQAVPVKFQLGGDRGLDILASGSPTSATIPCAGGAVDPIEETATAGASGLQYDAATQTYTYVWKTQRAWSGTCRRFTLKLDDGTVRTADFRFI
jgi:predicted extracellular nuclease